MSDGEDIGNLATTEDVLYEKVRELKKELAEVKAERDAEIKTAVDKERKQILAAVDKAIRNQS